MTMCTRYGDKVCYPSPEAANKRRKKIKLRRGDPVRDVQVFRCPSCRKWHLGSSLGERAKARR